MLESVPTRLAEVISSKLDIPTIGIGAGDGCDGQVLVTYDLLGLFDRFTPKFVKRYAEMRQPMLAALQAFREEVETRAFPTESHSYTIDEEEWQKIKAGMTGPREE